jgi:hypothetical protein
MSSAPSKCSAASRPGTSASYMPRGLGKPFAKEADELEFLLTEIPMRFKRAIEKGQQKGWAAK